MNNMPIDNNEKDAFLNKLCAEIKYKKIRPVIAEEYRNHIDESAADLIKSGDAPGTAYKTAVERMGDPAEIGKVLSQTHKPLIEWSVVLLTSALVIIGLAILRYINTLGTQTFFNGTTLISSTILGVLVFAFMMFFDYKRLEKISLPIFIITCAIFMTFTVNNFLSWNASRWIRIPLLGQFNIVTALMPVFIISFSGVVKMFCAGELLHISVTIDSRGVKKQIFMGKMPDVIILLILASIPVLTYLITSLSNVIILGVTFISMISFGILQNEFKGNSRKYITWFYGCIGFALTLFGGWLTATHPYFADRLKVWLHPELYANGMGYQSYMARLFVSSSKLFGETRVDSMSVMDRVPSAHNDFIFTAIIALFGWGAAIAILLLFVLFLWRIAVSSMKISDYYGRILSIGICAVFSFQIVSNILVCVGALPIGSVSLPFMSYGGTGFICNMALIGLLLGIYRRKDIIAAPLLTDDF